MQTREQWLLTQLASEAAEVAHAATKAIQFGLNDSYPGYGGTTRYRIIQELNDVAGVVAMLMKSGCFPMNIDNRALVNAKMDKVQGMYEYAKERGQVE